MKQQTEQTSESAPPQVQPEPEAQGPAPAPLAADLIQRPPRARPGNVRSLQAAVGNRAVQRWLTSRAVGSPRVTTGSTRGTIQREIENELVEAILAAMRAGDRQEMVRLCRMANPDTAAHLIEQLERRLQSEFESGIGSRRARSQIIGILQEGSFTMEPGPAAEEEEATAEAEGEGGETEAAEGTIIEIDRRSGAAIRTLPAGVRTFPAPGASHLRVPLPPDFTISDDAQIETRPISAGESYLCNIIEPSRLSGDAIMVLQSMGIGVGQGTAAATHTRRMEEQALRPVREAARTIPERSMLPTRLTARGVQSIRARAGRWVMSRPANWAGGVLSGLLNVLIPQEAASDDVIERRYRIGEDEFDVTYTLVRR